VKLIAALLTSLFFMIPPAAAIEDVMKQDQLEESLCRDICVNAYEAEYSYMPKYFFMRKCRPLCLARIECLPNDRLDPKGSKWECVDHGPQ
jgi:hypothetical protein